MLARRDPLLTALANEVDQAIVALQSARKLLMEMQRAGVTLGRVIAERRDEVDTAETRSLRLTGLTVPEAADVLEVTEEHVRRLLRKGELVGAQFGGRIGWRLPREHVEEVAAFWRATREGKRSARERMRRESAHLPRPPRRSPS